MIFLETTRLLFRPHEARDENDFVRMHTDPEVRRYVGGAAWSAEKPVSRFRSEYLGKPTKTYGLWATIFKEEERYIGSCGLRAGQNSEGAHLGCYLARPYWGRGLGSEACGAFVRVAFEDLDLPRLWADVENGNKASEGMVRKLGFRFTHKEEIPTSGRIICFYELLRSDWQKRQGSGPARNGK